MQVKLSNFGLRIKGNLLLLQLPTHVAANVAYILIIWYVWKQWVSMAPMCLYHKGVNPLRWHELSELPSYTNFKWTPVFEQRIDDIIMSMDADAYIAYMLCMLLAFRRHTFTDGISVFKTWILFIPVWVKCFRIAFLRSTQDLNLFLWMPVTLSYQLSHCHWGKLYY